MILHNKSNCTVWLDEQWFNTPVIAHQLNSILMCTHTHLWSFCCLATINSQRLS